MTSLAPIQVTVLKSSRSADKDDRARSVDFVGAFSTQKGKQLDVAKRSSVLKRIVKITIANGDSEYKRKGQAVHVKTFPLLEDQRQLSNYGCPVAVSLFLRFQTECAILFVLMAILAGPQLADNYNRSQARMDCRRSVALNDSVWDAVTARASANATYPAETSRCGWNGLPIQRNLSMSVGYLAWSVGTCQEFTTSAESFQPISASPDGTPKFVRTIEASYCQQERGGLLAASYWLQFVNVILFFGFLVRIRRFQRDAGVHFDRALWTAADYTVLLKGLDRNVPADARSAQIREVALQTGRAQEALGLEEHLYRDLAERGFPASDIVKIEIGRECKRDVVALGALKKLRVREQELTAQAHWRTQHGKSAMGVKMQAEWDELQESKAEVLQELEKARDAADYTTGHAFVTFFYERRRNELVRACRPKTCLNFLRSGVGLPPLSDPWASASGRRNVVVDAAAEPDDIKWENLAVDDSFRAKQTAKTLSATICLLVIAFACLVGAQVLEQDAVALVGRLGLSATDASSGYAVFNSLITVAINMLLKESVMHMTKWERRDTQTEFETSLFAKLSLAYIFNSVIIPLAVGIGISLRVTRGAWPVTQSWYEGGGVVQVAVPLIVSNGLITVLQAKMNELWEPPEMLLGELYASSLKTVGLCLVYAPLWPWAYPLTTIALLFNYGCTKVGVAYWYKKPPMVSEELMTKFRSRLGLLMLLHTLVAFLAADAADPAVEAGLFAVGRAPSVPVVAMFFAWVVYELLDLPDVLSLIPGLGPKDELSRTEDTKGIPYRAVDGKGGVKEVQQYDVDEYICPSLDIPQLDIPQLALLLLQLDIPQLDIPQLDIPQLDRGRTAQAQAVSRRGRSL
ncbi:hypothetical protein Ctob_006002 [Chrysochromulina tobinii]|uniref:Anoctamin transmembrane domain-containing protein n=1 Tax=Chrysochromulina tobinii TaxID=1460289 RepID=A0A0M0JXP8_9EUKA|nr:hypothetical protein Ctob_006002 [Chrysochromulina tobinii]|eukprot:KOO31436.1 hypothetical protein Ctob_006002 [Chrysochromulina sp. CCMP291]